MQKDAKDIVVNLFVLFPFELRTPTFVRYILNYHIGSCESRESRSFILKHIFITFRLYLVVLLPYLGT